MKRLLIPLILTLTWDAVPDAAGYLVCQQGQCINVGNVTEWALDLPPLPAVVSVKAYDSNGVEGEAAEIPVNIQPPSNVSAK